MKSIHTEQKRNLGFRARTGPWVCKHRRHLRTFQKRDAGRRKWYDKLNYQP